MSTVASHTIEEVAAAAPGGRRWFQLYVQRERAVTRALVERAAAAGYEALCLTVDLPVLGYRDEVLRLRFDPGEDAYANLPQRDVWRPDGRARRDGRHAERGAHLGRPRRDPVLGAAPARAQGHPDRRGRPPRRGARRRCGLGLATTAAGSWTASRRAIDVLEEVVDAVEGRAEVYLDGGIRRGPEILIALALGARAVFTARPFLWALACAGEAGVTQAFAILREELERGLALMGTPTPAASPGSTSPASTGLNMTARDVAAG